MADTYLATYISTGSAHELAYWYEEVAEESSANIIWVIKESYYFLNERLDTVMHVPIRKERTTGEYHHTVRRAQAMIAVAMLRERKMGVNADEVKTAWDNARAAIEDIVNFKTHFEEQYSGDELDIGYPQVGTANTSTATFLTDRTAHYTGDREKTYTITITTAGAVETAVYSWSDGEGNTTTGIKTHYEWKSLEEGVLIRCLAASGQTFVLADTWTIRCVPQSEVQTGSGGLMTIPVSK